MFVSLKNNNKDIENYFTLQLENQSEMVKKIEYLLDNLPNNGVVIFTYPSGTPLKILEKITTSLRKEKLLGDINYIRINTTHNSAFHLILNGSVKHRLIEAKQMEERKTFLDQILDIGCFKLVQLKNRLMIDEKNFYLYKTKDDFVI
ncbi:MAG: hypothetical protein KGI58_02430 [Patescibacteria group bacterium]|nr:hypothetical protein [Patescibacteria group bacterium]